MGSGRDAAIVMPDAAPDAPPVLGAWSTPAKVTVAATAEIEDDDTLSSDALELIFAVTTGDTKDLYYTSRTALDAPWAPRAKLPFDNASSEQTPRFTGDDRTLYFAADRTTTGNLDIYMVTRTAANNTSWGTPQLVDGLHTALLEKWLTPCTGGRYVVVEGPDTNGDTNLYEGTLGGGTPVAITALNTGAEELAPFLTQDCLTLYFSRKLSPQRIWVSHRATATSAWETPVMVEDFKLTGTDNQEDPWISPSGRIFGLVSDAAGNGNKDVYLSTR